MKKAAPKTLKRLHYIGQIYYLHIPIGSHEIVGQPFDGHPFDGQLSETQPSVGQPSEGHVSVSAQIPIGWQEIDTKVPPLIFGILKFEIDFLLRCNVFKLFFFMILQFLWLIIKNT